jgi:DNA replication protein DnaC
MDEKSVHSIQTLVSRSGGPVGPATPRNMDIKLDEQSGRCARCDGTGWKDVGSGTERRVTRCDCFLEAQAKLLFKRSSVPARYAQCTFAKYKTDSSNSLAVAKIAIESWAAQYPLDRTGLLLIGSSGTGKTHLAVAALRELTSKSIHCLFCDYRDLLKQIQNSYNPSVKVEELDLLRPVFEAEVLLLDDLGAVKPSEWIWDTVSLILNTRYNQNRTTLITSNFLDGPAAGTAESKQLRAAHRENKEQVAHSTNEDLTLADRIGERMRSRLFEMCRPVLVLGSDYRRNFRTSNAR